jgi:myosin heavy subunit
LQLELLQVSAEAQLVITQQVNELHEELGSTTADIRGVQDQLQQLACQQQLLQQHLNQQQGVQLQGEQLQQFNQQLQQVQMQLQQLQGSGLAAEQLAVQEQLQEQLQRLQQQQDNMAYKLEAQTAAAVAAAAADTAQQIDVLKQWVGQIERSQQEMLQGSHALNADSAVRDEVAQARLTAVEGQLMQQQEEAELLRKQLAELQQQQGAAEGVGQDFLQQQQQQLAGEVENIKQQLSQLQKEKQEQQLVHEAALAATGEAGAQAGAAAATEVAAALQEQVQRLELKVAQLQVQQAQDTPAAAAASTVDQSSRILTEIGSSIQQQMRAELAGEVMALQQQLHNLGSSVEQLQATAAAQGAGSASPSQHADAAASAGAVAGAAAAAAECGALQQQLLRLDQRVADMAGQLQECSHVAGITLPLRMSEVEERVAATAQTCADAVKVRQQQTVSLLRHCALNCAASMQPCNCVARAAPLCMCML